MKLLLYVLFHLFSAFEPTIIIWGKSGGGYFFSTLRYTTVKMLQCKTGAVCFIHAQCAS